jgi:hypothetical protein
VAPAPAAGVTYCVGTVSGCPSGAVTNLDLAGATTAATNGDAILVGPGTHQGPVVLKSGVTLDGSGAGTSAGATVITAPASAAVQAYVTGTGAKISDVRILMTGGPSSDGDIGLDVGSGSQVKNVVVIGGAGMTDARGIVAGGSSVTDATVNLTQGDASTAAVESEGGNNALVESTWNAPVGYRLSGTTNDIVQRVTINATRTGVWVQSGSLTIDDSVLDLASGAGAGLLLGAPTAAAKSVVANHLTIVGAATRGISADASDGGVTQAVSASVRNSIVRGPTTSLATAVSGSSTATVSVDHSDFQSKTGSVTEGVGNLDVDPAFVDPANRDYRLRSGSPVVDKGVATIAGLDRDNANRSFDGDGNGFSVPDLGAYELHDVTPPTTVITAGPSGPTNDNTPVFTFRSGPDATFECQLDGTVFPSCKSPVTTTPLPDGPHTFTVRARDEVFNVETNPPKRTFTVDTRAPDTTLTKKAPKRFYKPRVKFKFASSEPGTRFQCMLDSLPWRSCKSPFRYSVKVGKHRLLVRAVDAAGNQDGSPARYKFKRVPRPKHHHHHR